MLVTLTNDPADLGKRRCFFPSGLCLRLSMCLSYRWCADPGALLACGVLPGTDPGVH